MIVQLTGGTERDLEEATEFGLPVSSPAFCDVRRHRGRCPSHLAGETIQLLARKCPRRRVDSKSEMMSLLPYLQIAIAAQSRILHMLVCYRADFACSRLT